MSEYTVKQESRIGLGEEISTAFGKYKIFIAV